jgi:hypothetical protein
MDVISDRIKLLTDLRDIFVLQLSIDKLDESINLLQEQVDKHPISKYKNYRPTSPGERRVYEDNINDLSKIVSPLHRIMAFRNVTDKKLIELKERLKVERNKSYEELLESLSENEKALVTSSYDDSLHEGNDLDSYDNLYNIQGFNLDEYQKENSHGKTS